MTNRASRFASYVSRHPRARDVAALFVIVLMWLLFNWRLFAPNPVDRVQLAPGDFTQQFFVFRGFAFDELRHGRLPLWIPCVDSGYPYQADPQSAFFYPPGLFNLALHLIGGAEHFPLVALEWESTLHLLLASVCMYVFLRGETRRRSAALVGAIAFGFGGYLTGYPILQMAIVESAAWMPLALWGARRLAVRGDRRSITFTATPLALSILAGHPQTFTFIFYVVTIYFVYCAWRARTPWRGAAIRLVGTFGLAIALSAVQLLPVLEYARLSTRAALSFNAAGTGFPLSDIIQFAVTGAVSHWQPLYIGVIPLVLVGLSLGVRRRDTAFWWLIALAGLALSFGSNLAVFDPMYWLAPGYQVFRGQERHALIVGLGLSVLAAYGGDAVLRSMSRRARGWLRAEVRWLSVGLMFLVIALLVVAYLSWQGLDASGIAALPNRIALALLALAASLGTLAWRSSRTARKLWLPMALVVITGFDLATANREVNWVAPYDPFPPQRAVEAVRADAAQSIFRIHNEQRLPGHSLCMSGLDEIGGITPLRVGNYGRFVESVPREVRWQLLNVRYVVTWRGTLSDRTGQPVDATRLWQEGEGGDTIYVYRLNWDDPRAWVVHRVDVNPDRDSIFAALAEPGFDPQQLAYTRSAVPTEAGTGSEPVSVVAIEPSYLSFATQLNTPGLLVVSEVNYPGWIAIVNGEEMPIVEVDGVLRGVVLPAGPARVEFVYRPMSLIVGGALSAIGLALWLGLMLSRRSRQGGR